ncbi:MAG: 2-isopropylmalate synthase [Burkholderiaceae bacterium]
MLKKPSSKYRSFEPMKLSDRTWPDAVTEKPPLWCSVDLRDGNQALIEPMDIDRKKRMFRQLVKIGFKHIEIGFPSASQTEFDFVRALIDEDMIPEDVTIQVLTQAREHLIRRTFESLRGARTAIVHLYNATSPIMREVVLGMNQDEIVGLAVENAELLQELAAQEPDTKWTFEYSPEHWSGTEVEFGKRVIDAVTAVWQPTPEHPCIINLPSTVEYSTPNIFADMIEWTHRHLDRRDSIILSVHPHNDRGTGTAAGEFAVMAGADRIEGCLFGNGERTGNVDIVNMALNLYTQGVNPLLDFSDIDEIQRTVEHCNQIPVHPRHPYVGDLVFTSFSGSHQDAIKKAFDAFKEGDTWAIPYLPIDPKDVGRSYEAVIRVNSQSGKGGIAYLLQTEYGLELPRRLQIEFSGAVQRVMDTEGKELTADQLWNLFSQEYAVGPSTAPAYEMNETRRADSKSELSIKATASFQGKELAIEGSGSGPIDAFVQGFNKASGHLVEVLNYHEHATGAGSDAQAVAYVELRVNGGDSVFGVGRDANIITASLAAIVSGATRGVSIGVRKAA